MAQTTYNADPTLGFRGLLADPNDDAFLISLANGAAAAQGFGIMVRRDAANPEDQFDILSAAGQTPVGVLVHTHAQQDPSLADPLGVALLEPASVCRRGRVWVRVEEAITVGDPVYYRHTSGTGTEIGAFRNDSDGVGQVTTLTPTVVENDIYGLDIVVDDVEYHFEARADGVAGNPAIWTLTPTVANSTLYRLHIHIPTAPGAQQDFYFEYTSDGTATATEICDGFRTAMAADAGFTALVVASGTTTLILTGQTNGMEFDIHPAGVGAWTSVTETQAAGTSTATTLCNKFRTAMAADAAFTAAIVASGTTTLILTGQTAGQSFRVISAGHGTWASITETTAAGPTCDLLSSGSWLRGSSAAGVALLELNLP